MENLETAIFLLFILLLALIHTLGEVFYKKGSMMFVQRKISIKDISKLHISGFPISIVGVSIGFSLGVKIFYGILLGSHPLSVTGGLFFGSIAIFSVFFGKIIYQEQFSPLQLSGIVLIALGIILLV